MWKRNDQSDAKLFFRLAAENKWSETEPKVKSRKANRTKNIQEKEKQTNNKWVEEHGAEVNLSNGLLTYDCKSNE